MIAESFTFFYQEGKRRREYDEMEGDGGVLPLLAKDFGRGRGWGDRCELSVPLLRRALVVPVREWERPGLLSLGMLGGVLGVFEVASLTERL